MHTSDRARSLQAESAHIRQAIMLQAECAHIRQAKNVTGRVYTHQTGQEEAVPEEQRHMISGTCVTFEKSSAEIEMNAGSVHSHLIQDDVFTAVL